MYLIRSINRISIALAATLCLPILFSGCQAITKVKCDSKNWYNVGTTDGQSGKTFDTAFEGHNAACEAVGTSADLAAYETGYDEGILEFCTFDSGQSQARNGFENQMVCPVSVASVFDNGFSRGLEFLCTVEGGRQLATNIGIYRGTCPAESQNEFLSRYINVMENSKVNATTKQAEVNTNLNTVVTSLASVKANIATYDSPISKAKKSGNKAWEKDLRSSRAPLVNERNRLQSLERRYRADKIKADLNVKTAEEMLLQWGPILDAEGNK